MLYRAVLVRDGVPKDAGSEAAIDIAKEFAEHRKWHANVTCAWDGSRRTLGAENDHDPKGLALLDEFSDCLSAYTAGVFDGDLKVKSIDEVIDHVQQVRRMDPQRRPAWSPFFNAECAVAAHSRPTLDVNSRD